MSNTVSTTDLGFTNEEVPIGTHMCLIYTSEKERKETLLKFLLSGLSRNEQTACFSNNVTEEELRGFFSDNGISYDERKSEGMISLSGTNEVYFAGGTFDPDRMIARLTQFYNRAETEGIAASRVIGEMIPEINSTPGGERLLEYESRINLFVKKFPVTSMCQYDANAFDGATIMEILKVHPSMIVNGSVVHNPFFTEPEQYLHTH